LFQQIEEGKDRSRFDCAFHHFTHRVTKRSRMSEIFIEAFHNIPNKPHEDAHMASQRCFHPQACFISDDSTGRGEEYIRQPALREHFGNLNGRQNPRAKIAIER